MGRPLQHNLAKLATNYAKDAITGSITSATTFKSSDIHLPSDWDLATLPNKSFVS
jgi:hypothetical protein